MISVVRVRRAPTGNPRTPAPWPTDAGCGDTKSKMAVNARQRLAAPPPDYHCAHGAAPQNGRPAATRRHPPRTTGSPANHPAR